MVLHDKWPSQDEYEYALQDYQTAFLDNDLKNCRVRHKPLNGDGSPYVCVYQLGNWVIRCFVSGKSGLSGSPPDIRSGQPGPPSNIRLRYQEIVDFQRGSGRLLPFLMRNMWIDEGIKVGGRTFPLIKLPFIANAMELGDFLVKYHGNRQATGLIAQELLDIVEQLEGKQVAHGDLDPSNIMVYGTPPALSLRLIDFDGMYVPALANKGLIPADKGHIGFQLPNYTRTFGSQMDRFSALVIYLSLCALEQNPNLWEKCDDRTLFFLPNDFIRLGTSENFARLRQEKQNQRLQLCLDELQKSIEQSRMPRPLSEFVKPRVSIKAKSVEGEKGFMSSAPPTLYTGFSLPLPLEEDEIIPPQREAEPLFPSWEPAEPLLPQPEPLFPRREPEPLFPQSEPEPVLARREPEPASFIPVSSARMFSLDDYDARTEINPLRRADGARQIPPNPAPSIRGRIIFIVLIVLIIIVALLIAFIATQQQQNLSNSLSLSLVNTVVLPLPLIGFTHQAGKAETQEKDSNDKT